MTVQEVTRGHQPGSADLDRKVLQHLGGKASLRILALATNPETGASTRFRVLQWQSHLERAGFSLRLEAFFSPIGSQVLYRPGHQLAKCVNVGIGILRRSLTLMQASRVADILLIHREAFPFGRRLAWKALAQFPGPIVYDYDDAMFLPQREGRGLLARFEQLDTPKRTMALSDLVLAGNDFLATYARQHAKHVVLLPTCIDTERFRTNMALRRQDRLVVGWIGSHSTVKYLQGLAPVLARVAQTVPFELSVVGSPRPLTVPGLVVRNAPWSLEREVEDFQRCDIGVYPLWDDAWAKGKCAFKAIQFMACGVPVIATAVGANCQVIQDGVNGYLAATPEEWVVKLTRLLLTPELRQRLGQAGRDTVERRYSLAAHAPTLAQALHGAIRRRAALRGKEAHRQ